MHRMILEALLPYWAMLLGAFGVLLLLIQTSGARWNWSRVGSLHSNQTGSAQSLSFVLTLPVFLMVLMFIVQVSQLMLGVIVVHYAAFATARAAIVWIPAELGEPETANRLYATPSYSDLEYTTEWIGYETPTQNWKLLKVWSAAAQACAPISPSGRIYTASTNDPVAQDWRTLYSTLVPSSSSNPKIADRLANKLNYSRRNTVIRLQGLHKDDPWGPKYNGPSGVPNLRQNPDNPDDDWHVPPDPNELGWEDPLTLTVQHNLALLPGPGRLLGRFMASPEARNQDKTARRISTITGDVEKVYVTVLSASVTFTNEGLKSVIPYAEDQNAN